MGPVALTHLDSDQSRGLLEVLDRYRLGSVLLGPEDVKDVMYPQWQSMVDREDSVEVLAQAGQQVILEPNVELAVFNPPEVWFMHPNKNGVVLKLMYGEVSFLLTADIGSPTKYWLIRNAPLLNRTFLKVAHRSSRTSTATEFLANVVSPIGIISADSANSFGHPMLGVLERLETPMGEGAILHTDRDGAIEFIGDGQALWFKIER